MHVSTSLVYPQVSLRSHNQARLQPAARFGHSQHKRSGPLIRAARMVAMPLALIGIGHNVYDVFEHKHDEPQTVIMPDNTGTWKETSFTTSEWYRDPTLQSEFPLGETLLDFKERNEHSTETHDHEENHPQTLVVPDKSGKWKTVSLDNPEDLKIMKAEYPMADTLAKFDKMNRVADDTDTGSSHLGKISSTLLSTGYFLYELAVHSSLGLMAFQNRKRLKRKPEAKAVVSSVC